MRSGPVWILQIPAATKSLIKLHGDGAPVEFRESECILFWKIGSFGTSRGSI
jgi:hypothetical protein